MDFLAIYSEAGMIGCVGAMFMFMGAGWEKGHVVSWAKEGITVHLPRKKKNVCVRDNRNIKEDSSE